MANPSPLRQLAALYLRLGFTAFGGPAAHVAMLEEAAVRRLGWLNRAEFLDLLGACNLLPGPGSTQLAMAVALGCGAAAVAQGCALPRWRQ